VQLVVSDDGSGMDREALDQVFEPFFTTKGVGEGTGLGLATVYGVVRQNNGFVNVYSEPGRGTTFRIYLPRSEQAGTVPRAAPAAAGERPRGTETVLLVEDEKSIRYTTQRFLEQLGYSVLAAECPEQALRLSGSHQGGIDLLITDVVMPGMSGHDLAVELAETYPDMKCLYISGYTANVIVHRGVLDEAVAFLAKPFSRDQIALKVREVLDG
jgi:CheY-like chemotaxis protein